MYRHFTATNVLISLCALTFLLGMIDPNNTKNVALYYWESPLFQPLQLLSHLFVHGGVMHLLFNMLGLWMFGRILEQVWGRTRFLLFYITCGVGAALMYQLASYYQFQSAIEPLLAVNIPFDDMLQRFSNGQYYTQFPSSEQAAIIFFSSVVGASGAIYGVLVGFAFLFPNHKLFFIFLPFPIPAKFFVPALLSFDIYASVTGFSIFGANIAHTAHVGGALVGLILVLSVLKRPSLQHDE
ncbi:MAG: membrane associated rhomboid family serine protease [Candidatus Endobugula sp.]|jgi:membrane associated rhomboid family serine protease